MKTSSSGPSQTTGDILFLKRLLFLKASLDNETAINTASSIKLNEDRIFYPERDNDRLGSAPASDRRTRATTHRDDAEQSEIPLAITSGDEESQLMLMPQTLLNSARDVRAQKKPNTAGRPYRMKLAGGMRTT